MKNSFVRNRFVVSRNLASREKARELSCKGAKSSEDSGVVFEYSHGAPSYPTDVPAVSQPIQWSSEYADTDLALVYYNYRHYNPLDGRWTGRDAYSSLNLYLFCKNSVYETFDFLGESFVSMGKEDYDKIMTDAIATMEASGVMRELYEKELAKGIYGETVWSLPKSGGVCTANNELKITGDLKPDIMVHIYIQIDQLNLHR